MKKSQKKAVAVGAGVAAIAAAAVGTYFLTGKNAKNRKKVAKWAKDMQKDVAREISKAGKVTKAGYSAVVDQVAEKYEGVKNISTNELGELALDMKKHWDVINNEISSAGKQVRRVIPKTVKSVAKKVKVNGSAKKTAKKATKKVAKKAAKRS